MLKILHTESSRELGGQELRIVKKLVALKNKGYWVALVADKRSAIYKLAKRKGLLLFPLNLSKRDIVTFLRFRNIVISHQINIVHTHSSRDSWHGAILKYFYPQIKLVRTRHISTKISNSIFSKFLYSQPDLLFTTGIKIREQLIRYNRIDSNKIISLPTGVDLHEFDILKTPPAFHFNHFTIGSISVLRSWKGHDILFRALSEIKQYSPQIKCIVVGDGPQRNRLKNLAKQLRLENLVSFLGYRQDIPNILASLNLLVHPSIGHEGMPQVILQALAMEVPVIATDVGSVSEIIINNKTGYLANPGDYRQLASYIMKVYNDFEFAKKLAKKGKNLVKEKYSFDLMINTLEKNYLRLFL